MELNAHGPGLRAWRICLNHHPHQLHVLVLSFIFYLENLGKIICEEFGSFCPSYLMFNCVCKCSVIEILFLFKAKIRIAQGFPGGPVVKNPPANAGDLAVIPGPGIYMPWGP